MRGTKYTKYAEDTPEYKSMTKFGKLLGIKWKDWVEEVHDNMSGLEYVREIFLTFGVEANSKNKVIHQYLYHYFDTAFRGLPNVSAKGYTVKGKSINKVSVPASARQGVTIHLKDSLHTSGISFAAVDKQTIKGTITDVGKYTTKKLKTLIQL